MNSPGRTALIVGHPGHEIRAHRLLETARPVVYILTDGSGADRHSRLKSTEAILQSCGASAGSLFGLYPDRTLYQWILDHAHDRFLGMARNLAEELARRKITLVYGDMLEGYNPVHDITRMVINVAVSQAQHQNDPIANFDFPLTGLPDRLLQQHPQSQLLLLDDEAIHRKLASARNYPELQKEVDYALDRWGLEPFRREVFRGISISEGFLRPDPYPPYYETYGRQQIAAGKYQRLITYQQHMEPLACFLQKHL